MPSPWVTRSESPQATDPQGTTPSASSVNDALHTHADPGERKPPDKADE